VSTVFQPDLLRFPQTTPHLNFRLLRSLQESTWIWIPHRRRLCC